MIQMLNEKDISTPPELEAVIATIDLLCRNVLTTDIQDAIDACGAAIEGRPDDFSDEMREVYETIVSQRNYVYHTRRSENLAMGAVARVRRLREIERNY